MSESKSNHPTLKGKSLRIVTEETARKGLVFDPENAENLTDAVRALDNEGLIRLLQNLSAEPQVETDEDPSRVRIELETARMKLEKAEASSKMQTESLARLNHDVRGLMTTFLGMLELLRSTRLDDEQADHLDTMDGAARSVLRILGDSLEFAKLESSNLKLYADPVDPRSLLNSVSDFYQPRAQDQGINLHLNLPEVLPTTIEIDEVRLRQILGNLLENAIKFTSSGSVSLTAAVEETGMLDLEVKDTGVGIAQERLTEIFHPFVQFSQPAEAGGRRGVGLGLAIVRNLVDLMGGSIRAESSLGEGTIFRVRIPVAEIVLPDRDLGQEADEVLSEPRRAVLVVEDDPLNQKFTVSTAMRLGFEVDLANNGEEAVAMASEHDYDAILMDIAMPIMDGVEATKRIRGLDDSHAETRIIAVTGHVFENDRRSYRKAGMDGFLAKPFGIKDLREILLSEVD